MDKQFTITLDKEGRNFRFAKNGEILCGIAKVGTWKKRDIWKINGGRHDRSGNLLVHYIYQVNLLNGLELSCYSRKEIVEALHGQKVQCVVDIK